MPQVQVLEGNPGFGSQLGKALGAGLSEGLSSGLNQMLQQKQRKSALSGLKPFAQKLGATDEEWDEIANSGVEPQVLSHLMGQLGQQQAKFQAQEAKVRAQEAKVEEQKKEKLAPLKKGLSIVKRQEELLETGKLGPKFGGLAQKPKLLEASSKKGQRARSEYEQLGKSLISLGSNIPIRNQSEFNTLAEKLYDPTLNEAEIRGTLDAMRRIITESLKEEGERAESTQEQKSEEKSDEFVMMKDPQGNIRKVPKKSVLQAQKAGGVLFK